MSVCDVCKKRFVLKRLKPRLAIPEYRAMIGFWPWVALEVCDDCAPRHDRNFAERLKLLAPDVIENDEPIVRPVCLACAAVETDGAWHEAAKWVDPNGRPVRRSRFSLCEAHRGAVYADGIVISSNLAGAEALRSVLDELPAVTEALVARAAGWSLTRDDGPAGAADLRANRTQEETLADAAAFWQASPDGLEAKAAWLGPVRKDYRMRYRLDLVRDYAAGRRESLIVIRTSPTRFTTFRTVVSAAAAAR
jgi:hypothetical protein